MKLLTTRSLTCSLSILALLLLGQHVAQAEVLSDGVLTATHPSNSIHRPGCFYQIHNVTMTQGGVYTISLTSGQFDAYLIVLDDRGLELARDDDSGGNLNARVNLRAPYTGTFQIMVTTFARGETGRYRLHVVP